MAIIMNMEDYRNEKDSTIERLKKDLESEKRKSYMLQSENEMLYEQTQTFNLPAKELQELNRIAKEQDRGKQFVMCSAFRLYQSILVMMKHQNVSSMSDIKWPKFNMMEPYSGDSNDK